MHHRDNRLARPADGARRSLCDTEQKAVMRQQLGGQSAAPLAGHLAIASMLAM
jgi:hypothetical protein